MNLKTIFLLCVSIGLTIALTGCDAAAPTPAATATATPTVNRDKAIELATAECRKGHLVLVGNPATAEATLMTLGEADAAVKSADETTNYRLPAASKVWLVQLTGSFQVIGGPQGLFGASPTAIPHKPAFARSLWNLTKNTRSVSTIETSFERGCGEIMVWRSKHLAQAQGGHPPKATLARHAAFRRIIFTK